MAVVAWTLTETPPRTWRRLLQSSSSCSSGGNTSTYVEKTSPQTTPESGHRKHLHVRGEDQESFTSLLRLTETPPRTWRRPTDRSLIGGGLGNTSTYVEKTQPLHQECTFDKKHLHVRGEDAVPACQITLTSETPPRTWRRRRPTSRNIACTRNTSTYVEKTNVEGLRVSRAQKHLHVRGEDSVVWPNSAICWETPPRTWRRPSGVLSARLWLRNTSTYVEKT
ncbi:Uncharacterised protein [Leminorella richardii]|uniref:Uncharacterized protein n=1 Tax=Leminorella richardii TaxID=158841 RepID=A0A2X4USV1_9GAMM|nr:Uncharacterised protein [Leminorella richardii]